MTTEFKLDEIHHYAVVVEDLSRSMSLYSDALGLTWADPWTGEIPIVKGEQTLAPVVSFTMSLEGPSHMELIESTFDTVWPTAPGIHHVGVWVERVLPAAERMQRTGFLIEAISPTDDFCYLRSPDGARIELVSSRSRPDFARWLAGGQL